MERRSILKYLAAILPFPVVGKAVAVAQSSTCDSKLHLSCKCNQPVGTIRAERVIYAAHALLSRSLSDINIVYRDKFPEDKPQLKASVLVDITDEDVDAGDGGWPQTHAKIKIATDEIAAMLRDAANNENKIISHKVVVSSKEDFFGKKWHQHLNDSTLGVELVRDRDWDNFGSKLLTRLSVNYWIERPGDDSDWRKPYVEEEWKQRQKTHPWPSEVEANSRIAPSPAHPKIVPRQVTRIPLKPSVFKPIT